MSLRFFIDQCVPSSISQLLRQSGYEVLILKDYISIDSPDQNVIAEAQRQNSILISLNGDFADIVNYPPTTYQGIISIQLKDHPEIIPQLMQQLLNYLAKYNSMNDYQGKLLIVEVSRIRIRE
ncbi:hypothetical protein C7H19_21985 [Aphanothece hegewaldii CCALA 016]|uniref:DUF5615 domain-containing protein n=1 Tax=Aphanothece hegewaldii CCALA 016 TaxID=2107694 RepID=A0A2T1LS06_9CHRO|nr:DUF5615 family PIN-like protein [Aphanothece hegewaldii]PSF32116.1 hypothetical protein C7H19_21985 [Aphanothece hegewaldii CCALA 016]